MRLQLSDEQKKTLRLWWRSLQVRDKGDSPLPLFNHQGRGERAKLRRCQTPEDVLLQSSLHNLALALFAPDKPKPQQLLDLALVAGILSHVDQDDFTHKFAASLGSKKADRPAMSEMRFQQLQTSREVDDFYRQVRRAIDLLGNKVDVIDLAQSLFDWCHEQRENTEPAKRLKLRWATDYYTASLTKNA
ncbi:MAG: type I-E CRISPR-associated protein Cse2/CasB [Iodobacter sp.]